MEVSLEFPTEVELNKEIIFKVITDGTGTYDVKIDPLNPQGSRVARILNSGVWKSTNYYVISSLNSEQEYKLIFQEYTGMAYITLKLRDSSGKVETFVGYEIKIKEASSSEIFEEEETPEVQQNQINDIKSENENKIEYEKKITNFSKDSIVKKEVIDLTPKTIKSDISSEEKGPIKKIYYVTGFCLLLSLLFLIDKQKKSKKNEFN